MNKSLTNEQLVDWYNHYEESKKHPESISAYAREHNLNSKQFSFYHGRFDPWTGKYRNDKEREIYCAELYIATGAILQPFCIKHKISVTRLQQVKTHLRLMKKINELKEKNTENNKAQVINTIEREKEASGKMSFIEAPREKELITQYIPEEPKQQEAQVFEAQNDLELIISKGVRVIVSPQIDNLKLIKIIEFLKDL